MGIDDVFTICAWTVVTILTIFTVWGLLKIFIYIEKDSDDDL